MGDGMLLRFPWFGWLNFLKKWWCRGKIRKVHKNTSLMGIAPIFSVWYRCGKPTKKMHSTIQVPKSTVYNHWPWLILIGFPSAHQPPAAKWLIYYLSKNEWNLWTEMSLLTTPKSATIPPKKITVFFKRQPLYISPCNMQLWTVQSHEITTIIWADT